MSHSAPRPADHQTLMIYVGGYTDGKSGGIHLFRMDSHSGKVTPAGLGPESVNPSFLAIDPKHRFLYSVNETAEFGGVKNGAVSAYAVNPTTGELTLLNEQPSGGASPCYLVVDSEGKHVLVANYGGSVAVIPIKQDGSLGPATCVVPHHGSSINPGRQEGPHAHSINLDRTGRFAYAADLGLDKILLYRFDPLQGTLTPSDPAEATAIPGSGPRHLVFSQDRKQAYVINELSNTITVYWHDNHTGSLKPIQTVSTVPDDWKGGGTAAEIQLSPDGRFLYGSNRGHDSIVIFQRDGKSGHLSLVGWQPTGGKTPRNFCIDPDGRFLLAANQDSNNIVVFRIDNHTGGLVPTGEIVQVPLPTCIKMMPFREDRSYP